MAKVMLLLKSSSFDSTNHSTLLLDIRPMAVVHVRNVASRCGCKRGADLFGQSTAEVVYHISILERLMPGLHKVLPMYYAILNSFLFSALKAANIRNRSGQSITFRYVNVATQFQCATDRTKLFKPKEVGRGEMVHRTSSAYREIFGMVRQYVLRDLGI